MKRSLSFAEAQKVGQGMYDRWAVQSGEVPPLTRDDGAWADLARFVFEQTHGKMFDAGAGK